MPRDSQGNCTQNFNWVQDDANSIGIESDRHQTNDEDHLQMLTDSLDRQGRGGMQADLKMGNNKVTQVAQGSDGTDGLNLSQAQEEAYQISATDTGTANNYIISLTPSPTAYNTGLTVKFGAANANTGASTLQVGSLVPAPALQWQSKDLVANDITAGALVEAVYDGIAFQITNVPEVLQVAHGGTSGTTQEEARTGLGLGTAAVEDVGTEIGDVVQLEDVGGNAGLPAVDGSQLTGLAQTVTYGSVSMRLANSGTTGIVFNVGQAADTTGAYLLTLSSALTKLITASWTAGTGVGGLFSGSVTQDTTYHCFLIRQDSDGAIDAGFDTSVTAANIPAGYTAYRRVGSIKTEPASTNIKGFYQKGDHFWWTSIDAFDVNQTNPGTLAVTWTANVPSDVEMLALVHVYSVKGTGNNAFYLSALAVTDQAPNNSNTVLGNTGPDLSGASRGNFNQVEVLTNTSAQARYRLSASDGSTILRISTAGWEDDRSL